RLERVDGQQLGHVRGDGIEVHVDLPLGLRARVRPEPLTWPGQPELLERIETVSQRTRGRQPRNVDDLLAVRDDNALANAIPALSLSDPTVLIQHGLEAIEVVVPLLTGTAHGRWLPDRRTQLIVPAFQALVHRPQEISVSRRLPWHSVNVGDLVDLLAVQHHVRG